jgi:multicomponent Na+:H+ antiporter subunit A
MAALAASPPTGTAVEVGVVLVLLGAFTKSAQFPFSAWLPGAMVAPTPVSAFLHSATMVKAGVYLIARMAPVFVAVGFWRPLVLAVGLATMVTGGWRALRQTDLKRILAYGTVSQLGFLVVLFGSGTEVGALAGVTVLFAHALFKACLFLVVGVIDHQAHTRDIRVLGRYGPGWVGPKVVATAAGASMAGIPLLFGFVAKESAYEAFLHGEFDGSAVVLAGLVIGSVLTFAYTARLLLGAFTTWAPPSPRANGDLDTFEPIDPPPAPALVAWTPAAVLGAATVVLGLVPGLADPLVGASVVSLHPAAADAHLAVWHGFNAALVLSVLTVSLGLVMAVGSSWVAAAGERLSAPIDGATAYAGALRGLNRLAQRTVAIVQPGSLSIYIGVILLTAVVVPGAALARSSWPSDVATTSAPGDLLAAGLLVGGAVGAAVVRERIAAVICLGAVGYGMALVFLLQGAPDLALTQMAVDTLLVVAFVLVLRRLPRRFTERPSRTGQVVRLVVAALVGTFMFVVVLVAGGARVADPVSDAFLTLAPTEGGGRNVVNVVLVDIRGFDTMGEITVLVIASLGVYGLVRSGRRSDAR